MTYPTPCCVKGCFRYVNLDRPLASNIRFVCPQCEDAIVASLMHRMEAAGQIMQGNAEWIIQNVKHFRYRMRKAIATATEGLAL